MLFVRLNPDRFSDPRYEGLENRLYVAERVSEDEIRIQLPDGAWVGGDPAHFHLRRGAIPAPGEENGRG